MFSKLMCVTRRLIHGLPIHLWDTIQFNYPNKLIQMVHHSRHKRLFASSARQVYVYSYMKGLCWLHAVCCSIISSSWQKCAAGMAIIAHTSQPAPLSLLFMNLCISNFLWRKIKAVTQRAGQMRKESSWGMKQSERATHFIVLFCQSFLIIRACFLVAVQVSHLNAN